METKAPFLLFDDAKMQAEARVYTDPVRILSCCEPEKVTETLNQIEDAIKEGFHVAGYLAYELGYLLEDKLAPLRPVNLHQPLIWMGVFKTPAKLSNTEIMNLMKDWAQKDHTVSVPKATITRDQYLSNVATIQDHIRAGDVYQINYTFKQNFDFSGSPKALYAQLRGRQKASYGAFIDTGDQHILSLSPELFYETSGDLIRTRPMKGTAPRAPSPSQDQGQRHWLSHDEKSKAENLMIVDLLRNDLSRISAVGSVNVTDLFSVETYPTLHQMTSGIEAKLLTDTSFADVINALFPCGSITGAPKVKAMGLIRSLEDDPRGVYTGAIGYASLKDGARFNVAIRTLTIDSQGQGEMGIGSGIVYDSDPAQEWDECHLKAHFMTDKERPPFDLLETLKWDAKDGFCLLRLHLDRLESAAAYFGYPYNAQTITAALDRAVDKQTTPQRVRLTLDDQGIANVTTEPLSDLGEMTFSISSQVINTNSPFTYHKTTNRSFYDEARAGQNTDEVLFMNGQGQLTEGSFTNLFVEKDGQLITPPVSVGLLNGTLRQDLIDTGQAIEAPLTVQDLKAPNKVFCGNSVRGLVAARPL